MGLYKSNIAKQPNEGLNCVRLIAKHHGKIVSIASLRSQKVETKRSNSLIKLAEVAETIGFRARCLTINFEILKSEIPFPCIVKLGAQQFAVVKMVTKDMVEIQLENEIEILSHEIFCEKWLAENQQEGVVLLLDTTPEFFQEEKPSKTDKPLGLRSLLGYLNKYPKLLVQLVVGMLVGTLLKLIVPFLTQSIVDVGVMNNNLNFIYLFFAAQLMLMLSRNALEAIRGWGLLYISSRVGVSLLTDFVAKIMRLPVSYFNEKAVGEVMQRVEDQKRIETFLSAHLSTILFSVVNLIIYTAIFAIYDFTIFVIFTLATLLYLGWISLFMKKRREADFKRAKIAEQEQNKLVQLVQGMADIKLANAEMVKRWDWEQVRAKLFRQNIKLLKLSQLQQIGGFLINETKNLVITFLSAKAVLDGHLSLGAMLAVQQMLGQTNVPTEQLFAYLQQIQDARISTERINTIHQLPEEEEDHFVKTSQLPENESLILRNLNFQYPNASATVLRDINLTIQSGQTTAIVGSSGSGKTTLLKLLIKHFDPTTGEVSLGNLNLRNVATRTWRAECGVVMTDGVIFADTILQNIALGDDDPDMDLVQNAARIANINSWIETTSMGYYSKIGDEYGSISQGQKQRLLIARAVYKNPAYLFFDEGTSALDSQNQQIILKNLNEFFKERTTVVVAHRLSTIKNAHQIVVIEEGQIVEKGNHQELINQKGRYYSLLTTQLESAT